MKQCSKCKEEKPFDCFNKDKHKNDGLATYCKVCLKAAKALYYQKNKDKVLKTVTDYQKTEAGKSVAAYAQRRYRNTTKGKEAIKAYTSSEKGLLKNRLQEQKRRARLKENGAEHFTYDDLRMFWLSQNILDDRCYYCLKAQPNGPEHLDHYIPIAKGGGHFKHNLRPSCTCCNLRKSDKHPIQFMKEINNG